jgi:hypothetical protein
MILGASDKSNAATNELVSVDLTGAHAARALPASVWQSLGSSASLYQVMFRQR